MKIAGEVQIEGRGKGCEERGVRESKARKGGGEKEVGKRRWGIEGGDKEVGKER